MATQKVTLGYWNIRGLGEAVKTLLGYLNIPYDFEEYTSKEQWDKKKYDKSLTFANLPYLIDGDTSLTESEAIFAHLCLKAGKDSMLGKPEDRVQFIQLRSVTGDVIRIICNYVYSSKNYDEIKEKVANFVETSGRVKLGDLDELLGKREWLLGYLTYVDFLFAEFLDKFMLMDKEIGTNVLTNFPNLQDYTKRFHEIPSVKARRESGHFKVHPCFLPHASWSNS